MLPLHRLRAHLAAITSALPDAEGVLTPERLTARLAGLASASSGAATVQSLGRDRSGATIPALRIGPVRAPALLAIGALDGAAPLGALSLLTLARHLVAEPALVAEAGVAWWLVPCADPDGLAARTEPLATLPTIARYAMQDRSPAPDPSGPGTLALLRLIDDLRPPVTVLLDEAPIGGAALFAYQSQSRHARAWQGRAADFARAIDLLGVPLDLGGTLDPAAVSLAPGLYARPRVAAEPSPYRQFRAMLAEDEATARRDTVLGRAVGYAGAGDGLAGAVIVPRFADYLRREADRTLGGATREAIMDDGIRLWREWFAFGRTVLDLVAPAIARAGLIGTEVASGAERALRGGEAIIFAGLGWAAQEPRGDRPATVAEAFGQDEAIRFARLPRIAALLRLLDAARDRLGESAPDDLTAARDRVAEMRDRWLDDLTVGGTLRPLRLDRAVGAQLAALLLSLPRSE